MNRVLSALNFLFLFFSAGLVAAGQSSAGITGSRDTSYTTYSAYNSTKKGHPFIEIVPYRKAGGVKEIKSIVYCTQEGRKLVLDAFLPAGKATRKLPVILFIHGGGWRSGDRSQHYPLAQSLANLGYAVFTPEYRLSTEALYPAAVDDLKAALRWIYAKAGSYQIDTAKVAVAGFSAGGQLAALLATTINDPRFQGGGCHAGFSSRVHALIDLDGTLSFVHPESGEGDDSKRVSAATYWFGYAKEENRKIWEEASPLTHVNASTPPTLFINSGVARMRAGRDDFMSVLKLHGVRAEVRTFEAAPHSFPLFHPWFDSTVQVMDSFLRKVFDSPAIGSKTLVVAKDGSGQYSSVQAAFDAIPKNNQSPISIFVKNGVYTEKLYLDSSRRFVTLLGEDKFKTILTWNDHTGKMSPQGQTINTNTSHSFLQAASDFTARNITFQNDAGFSAGQAVAVRILGDRCQFIECRFIGNQDVLYPSEPRTRQYFERCYIEGTTDFIFGPSVAWFEQCHIHSKKNSHITAASTPAETKYGYVFNECILTGDTSLHSVSLGRPWKPYSSVTYLRSWIGPHILGEGWNNWKNPANESTARYAEYQNFGPGANPAGRLNWTRQLTDAEAKTITLPAVFGNWLPSEWNRTNKTAR